MVAIRLEKSSIDDKHWSFCRNVKISILASHVNQSYLQPVQKFSHCIKMSLNAPRQSYFGNPFFYDAKVHTNLQSSGTKKNVSLYLIKSDLYYKTDRHKYLFLVNIRLKASAGY